MRTAIFTMGIPAAGKSRHIKNNFDGVNIIDPDQIKNELPGWKPRGLDAATRDLLHGKSKLLADAKFAVALTTDDDFILDGTGTNFAPLIKKIRQASDAGFKTRLVYVTCSLATSLKRNAKRERVVPESIIREKYDGVEIAFEIVAKEADEIIVIDNN